MVKQSQAVDWLRPPLRSFMYLISFYSVGLRHDIDNAFAGWRSTMWVDIAGWKSFRSSFNVCRRNSRRFRFGPLVGFTVLSFVGFAFFATSLTLIWFYYDEVNEFLSKKYNEKRLGKLVRGSVVDYSTSLNDSRQHESLPPALDNQLLRLSHDVLPTAGRKTDIAEGPRAHRFLHNVSVCDSHRNRFLSRDSVDSRAAERVFDDADSKQEGKRSLKDGISCDLWWECRVTINQSFKHHFVFSLLVLGRRVHLPCVQRLWRISRASEEQLQGANWNRHQSHHLNVCHQRRFLTRQPNEA